MCSIFRTAVLQAKMIYFDTRTGPRVEWFFQTNVVRDALPKGTPDINVSNDAWTKNVAKTLLPELPRPSRLKNYLYTIILFWILFSLKKSRRKVIFLVDSPLRPWTPPLHSGHKNGSKLKRKHFWKVIFSLVDNSFTLTFEAFQGHFRQSGQIFGSTPKRYKASRTYAHRTLAHNWYFIDACQVISSP